MTGIERDKLEELCNEKRVLYVCYNSPVYLSMRESTTIDYVSTTWSPYPVLPENNTRYHVGKDIRQLVSMFLPNFQLVIIDGKHRRDTILQDLGLAYDKIAYGGTIAYIGYTGSQDIHDCIDRFLAESHRDGTGRYLPYHIYTVDDLCWFTVDWDQHKKVADTNMPATS